MTLKNLSRCLESNSIITSDVKFVFNNQSLGETVTVSAHKVILSIASDVFETQLYGEIQEQGDEINITDASYEAFKTMVEFIYNRKCVWVQEELNFLAEMYYLGEKYHLDDLKEELLEAVTNRQVARSNLLYVATLAEEQAHHPALSKCLYTIAAKYLQNKFKGDIKEVLKLFSEVEADPTDATNSFILHKLMTTINDIRPLLCTNCNTNPCLHGKEPTRFDFVAGARIRIVQGKHYNSTFILNYASMERLSRTKPNKFIGKKVTGYISCYFGKGSYFYKCSEL